MTDRQQSGFVIVVSVAVIAVLVGVFGYMIQNSYRRTIQAELQAAADAAAHAGARRLSSTVEGYDSSRFAAATELSTQTVHRGFNRPSKLPLLDSSQGPTWEVPDDYTISVIRGAWWPDGAPDTDGDGKPGNGSGDKFIALESANGSSLPPSAQVPNLPAFLVANAVSVTVILKKAKGPFAFLGDLEVSAHATAVGGVLGEVTTAPFAIPACSLLAGTADFNPPNRCASDIYFTRRDRYCPPDNPRCGAKPGFFAVLDQTQNSPTVILKTEQCSFATESMDSAYLYGMVVGPNSFTTEAAMRGNDFKVTTKIGGRVTVIEKGFSEAATGAWMTSLMSLGDRTTANMSQERGTGGGSYTVISKIPTTECVESGEPVGLGACNTTGFSYEEDNWVSNSFNSCQVARVLAAANSEIIHPFFGGIWPGRDVSEAFHSVWSTKASVVVWSGMEDCAGINGATQDPAPPPPGSELTVIGFIDIDVYGVDVGQETPKPPDNIFSKGHRYWNDDMGMCRGCDRQCEISDQCSGACEQPQNCINNCTELFNEGCNTCHSECPTAESCVHGCANAVGECESGCPGCAARCDEAVPVCMDSCVSRISTCLFMCADDECRANCSKCTENCASERVNCQTNCESCRQDCHDNAKSRCENSCTESIDPCHQGCDNCASRFDECKRDCTTCESECQQHQDCITSCQNEQAYSCDYRNPHSCDPDGRQGPIPNQLLASHGPWGFSPPVAATEPDFKCNLVRARTRCEDNFIPAIQNGRSRDITIVR